MGNGIKLDKLLRGPSIDSYEVDVFKHVLNTDVVRRLLIKYFCDKGFNESFDRQLYPGLIQDLTLTIPVLSSKVEIVPYVEELDMSMSKAILGWNLFVLGNKRMFLGETYHNNLSELARQIRSGVIKPVFSEHMTARRQTTPRRIVAFITRVLGDSELGYVDLNPSTRPIRAPGEQLMGRQTMMGIPQQFFNRS